VAPLASVKSVSAHMELHTVGGCGFGSGMIWSSAWMGWATSPGPMAMEDRLEIRQPLSEHALHHREDLGPHRDLGEARPVSQQVVDAPGGVALEAVGRRLDAELPLQPVQVLEQGRRQ
jgi:hypothetical protein